MSIPPALAVIDSGDSWQAHDDHRIVYVTSLAVSSEDGRAQPAREIAAVAAKKLPSAADREQMMHESSASLLVGGAVIQPATNLGWELRGYMAGDGTVAFCVIDFDTPALRDWAVETWRSLDLNE